MRNDTNKDFDLLFKEALSDAEVKAPRGAWKAVSARLDAAAPAAAAAPRRSWLLWGAPAFALAAAALAVVLFVGTTEKTIIESGEELIAAVEQPSGPVAQVEETTDQASNIGTRAGFVPKEIQTLGQISVLPSVIPDPDRESKIADQVGDDEPEDRQAGGLGGTPHSPLGVQGDDSEPAQQAQASQTFWAEMETENAQAAKKPVKKISLQAGGIVGGNDYHNPASRPAFSSGLPSAGIQETTVSIYGIPVSLGLGARYHFTEKLAASAGVNWSFLSRTFQGKYKTEVGTFTHNLQYVGLPVSLSYDVVDSKTLMFYCYGGGVVEKAVSSKYYIYDLSAAPLLSEKVPSLQYGVFGGIGVEFKLSDLVGLYVDPCVKYYFPGDQPKSIRTDKPLMFSFEAGLRFNL